MKIALNAIILLLFIFGCKIQKGNINNEPRILNNNHLNSISSEIIMFNLKNEPDLLDLVNTFKTKNNNSELEDKVILDFFQLQSCNKAEGTYFQDYPNELQSIYDFYSLIGKENLEWLNNDKVSIFKFTSIRFIVKNANDGAAFEYLKID